MLLYHFTSSLHLPRIIADGFIKTGDNMLRWNDETAEPRCSFHFDVPEVPAGYGGITEMKTEVRLTLDVPNAWAVLWIDWARAQGIEPMWLSVLTQASGGEHHYEHEYAVFRRIPLERCLDIRQDVLRV